MPKLLILIFLLFTACSSLNTEFDILIHSAQVIDFESDSILENQLIGITDGRIEFMEEVSQDDVENYSAKTIIDAQNKFVLPGFWDNHVHFRGGEDLVEQNKALLKLYIANGVTSVRDAGGDITDHILDWRTKIANNKTVGPTIFTSGPKIDGENATWAGSLPVENFEDVNAAIDSLESLGVDYIKLYDSRISGEMFLETLRQAQQRGYVTSGHMPFSVTLNESIDNGFDGVEHLYYVLKGTSNREIEVTEDFKSGEVGFWGSMNTLIESYDETTAQLLFNKMKDFNVFVVPTLHIGSVLSYVDTENHEDDEYLKLMPEEIVETYAGRVNSAKRSSAEARASRRALNDTFIELANTLNEAGVKLMAGSDSGPFNSYVYPGISLHSELEAMVEAGMSPIDALRNSVIHGPQFLGKTTDYGNLSVGKVSDIVILNENPLEDITNTRKIYIVVKGNQVYTSEQLKALEAEMRD